MVTAVPHFPEKVRPPTLPPMSVESALSKFPSPQLPSSQNCLLPPSTRVPVQQRMTLVLEGPFPLPPYVSPPQPNVFHPPRLSAMQSFFTASKRNTISKQGPLPFFPQSFLSYAPTHSSSCPPLPFLFSSSKTATGFPRCSPPSFFFPHLRNRSIPLYSP